MSNYIKDNFVFIMFSMMIKSELEDCDRVDSNLKLRSTILGNLKETPPNTSFLCQIRTNNEMIPMIPP